MSVTIFKTDVALLPAVSKDTDTNRGTIADQTPCWLRLTIPDADGVDADAGQGLAPGLFNGLAGKDGHEHGGKGVGDGDAHDGDDGDAELVAGEDAQVEHAEGRFGEACRDLVEDLGGKEVLLA